MGELVTLKCIQSVIPQLVEMFVYANCKVKFVCVNLSTFLSSAVGLAYVEGSKRFSISLLTMLSVDQSE